MLNPRDIEKPILNLNPPHIQNMKEQLKSIKYACTQSFSGGGDWRAKQSYQKQADVLEKKIGQEQCQIQKGYDEAMEDYNKQIQELVDAEKKFKNTTSIKDISLSSDLIEEDEDIEKKDVNSISDLGL